VSRARICEHSGFFYEADKVFGLDDPVTDDCDSFRILVGYAQPECIAWQVVSFFGVEHARNGRRGGRSQHDAFPFAHVALDRDAVTRPDNKGHHFTIE